MLLNLSHRLKPVLGALGLILAGCGGGGGGDGNNSGAAGSSPDPAGPSASFAQQCAVGNALAATSLRTASLETEKKWLRAYFDEAYLWRDQVPRVDPSLPAYSSGDVYSALDAYFLALTTQQVTDMGARRDRFSFTYPTAEWNALSDTGAEVAYGIEWHSGSATPPRQLRIAYVAPGSPAAAAGLRRGDALRSVNGVDADTTTAAGVDVLSAGLFPSSTGVTNAFVFSRAGVDLSRNLTSAHVTKSPVPQATVLNLTNGTRVGYLLFNDHNLTSEQLLIDAVRSFRQQNISELVLDLRYNSGGYLFVASELATMIAGTARTSGQAFEMLRYNARRSAENETTPFFADSCIADNGRCTSVQPLPTLNLGRVYVLAQQGTCSASESIINGLRGVDVEVVLVGGQTCGKPYGFTAKDNCGISYFPIEFYGVNAKGFGDYGDGFVPGTGATDRFVRGCSVADDFSRELGDLQEGMLGAALNHVVTGQCPAVSASPAAMARAQAASAAPPLYLQGQRLRSRRLLLPR
jgi:C-terminal processing protease CtpA/Prc